MGVSIAMRIDCWTFASLPKNRDSGNALLPLGRCPRAGKNHSNALY
jgi:hypothetical protein